MPFPKSPFILGLALSALVFARSGPVMAAPDEDETGLVFEPEQVYRSFPAVGTYRAFLPQRIDLSERMPPAGSQGKQSSCVGWATSYGLRGYYENRRRGLTTDSSAPPFSPSFVYNQIKTRDADCKTPTSIADALNLLKRVGTVPLEMFPYDPASCSRQPDLGVAGAAQSYRIDDWRRLDLSRQDDIKGQLYAGNPVVIGMLVNDDFHKLRGDTVFSDNARDGKGHAMVVVGYDDDMGAFKLFNSWGARWGEDGFGWVAYDAFRARVRSAFVMEMRAGGRDDPAPDPTPEPSVEPRRKSFYSPPPAKALTPTPDPEPEPEPSVEPRRKSFYSPPPAKALTPAPAPEPEPARPSSKSFYPSPQPDLPAPAPKSFYPAPTPAPAPAPKPAVVAPDAPVKTALVFDPGRLPALLAGVPCSDLHADGGADGRISVRGVVGTATDGERLAARLSEAGITQPRLDLTVLPWPQCEAHKTFGPALDNNGGLSLHILGASGKRPVLAENAPLVIEVITPSFAGYLYVVYLQAGGDAVFLHTPAAADGRPWPARSRVTIGDGGGGQPAFAVGPPYGDEMILALSVPQALPLPALPQTMTEREFLSLFRTALLGHGARGVKRVVNDHAAAAYTLLSTRATAP